MDISFAILVGLLSLVIGYLTLNTGHLPINGLLRGGNLFLALLPRLLVGFALAGLIQQAVPEQAMQKWLGHDAGVKGMMIGSLIGMVLPGGPYVIYPLIAGLRLSGASIGSLLSLVTAKELFGPVRLIAWEYPLLGGEFLVVRCVVSFLVPLLVGMVGQQIYLLFF
ncbi:MAG: permease [Chloroflexota bacterium]|jgi:uncharacterized membrane protein YraQ (UPF0718 family)